jgi:hypothetical protein
MAIPRQILSLFWRLLGDQVREVVKLSAANAAFDSHVAEL